MARSLTSSRTALNAPAKQAQITRISSNDEAASLAGGGAAGAVCWPAVALGDACAVACADLVAATGAADAGAGAADAGAADAGAAGAGAGADAVAVVGADAVAGAGAVARPAGCAARACGDGWVFFAGLLAWPVGCGEG